MVPIHVFNYTASTLYAINAKIQTRRLWRYQIQVHVFNLITQAYNHHLNKRAQLHSESKGLIFRLGV